MLRVTGGAAIAATENLAAVEQAFHHHLAGGGDHLGQHFAGLGLGFHAFGEQLSDAVHTHYWSP